MSQTYVSLCFRSHGWAIRWRWLCWPWPFCGASQRVYWTSKYFPCRHADCIDSSLQSEQDQLSLLGSIHQRQLMGRCLKVGLKWEELWIKGHASSTEQCLVVADSDKFQFNLGKRLRSVVPTLLALCWEMDGLVGIYHWNDLLCLFIHSLSCWLVLWSCLMTCLVDSTCLVF